MISDAQRRVLECLAKSDWQTPATIGWAMVEGRDTKAAHKGSAQGLGRIGGGMCRKMIDQGLVRDASRQRRGFPAYAITAAGRAALSGNP